MTTARAGLLFLLTVSLLLFGCGPNRPKTIAVTGTVTFAGNPPPASGVLYFACTQPAEGYTSNPAMGSFDAAGKVSVAAFEDSPGLVPGKYEVRVECWKTRPNENSPGESHVPANFAPVVFDVPADASGPVELKIDVK